MSLPRWGHPPAGPPQATVTGGDADLAAAVDRAPGSRLAFRPDEGSDLARTLGLRAAARPDRVEVALDALRCGGDLDALAVNAVVVGVAPHRLRRTSRARLCTVVVDGRQRWCGPATTVVVATGQFLAGADVVPRGHPGDGRAEVQVYAVPGPERAELRRRLASGTHLPHPAIRTLSGVEIEVRSPSPRPVAVDGTPRGRARDLRVRLVAGAYSLVL